MLNDKNSRVLNKSGYMTVAFHEQLLLTMGMSLHYTPKYVKKIFCLAYGTELSQVTTHPSGFCLRI